MPKTGQDLKFDYFETRVRPGTETQVGMFWEGPGTPLCMVTTRFTPQAGRYPFRMASGPSGTCTLNPSLIERDKDGVGWHLVPNQEVAYPHDEPTAKTTYRNSQFEDPDYQPPAGLYPGMSRR